MIIMYKMYTSSLSAEYENPLFSSWCFSAVSPSVKVLIFAFLVTLCHALAEFCIVYQYSLFVLLIFLFLFGWRNRGEKLLHVCKWLWSQRYGEEEKYALKIIMALVAVLDINRYWW